MKMSVLIQVTVTGSWKETHTHTCTRTRTRTHTGTQQLRLTHGHFLSIAGGYLLLMSNSITPCHNTQEQSSILVGQGLFVNNFLKMMHGRIKYWALGLQGSVFVLDRLLTKKSVLSSGKAFILFLWRKIASHLLLNILN